MTGKVKGKEQTVAEMIEDCKDVLDDIKRDTRKEQPVYKGFTKTEMREAAEKIVPNSLAYAEQIDRQQPTHEHCTQHDAEERTAYLKALAELQALRNENQRLKDEIDIDNKLIDERNRILKEIPCPEHGNCVPHVIEEIRRMKAEIERVRQSCAEHTGSHK